MPFKVIQSHQIWNKSKAHMRLPCLDGVSLTQNFRSTGRSPQTIIHESTFTVITILAEVAFVLHAFDRQDIAIPRLRSCSVIEITLKTARSYGNPHTVSRLHRPNVSFIYKQSVHGITVTICLLLSGTFLVTNTI